jgi:hypothetical protein
MQPFMGRVVSGRPGPEGLIVAGLFRGLKRLRKKSGLRVGLAAGAPPGLKRLRKKANSGVF